MENKCLVRNKKKQRSLFHQFTYTGKEVISLIKKNKIKELDVIYKLSVKPINSVSMHYKFYILLQSKQLKIVELVIKDLKIDTPLTEDAIWKINNLKKFSGSYAEFVKSEYERYFKKYNLKDIKITCIDGMKINYKNL